MTTDGHLFARRKRALLVVASVSMMLVASIRAAAPNRVIAQEQTPSNEQKEAARVLAQQALDALHRGRDAPTKPAQMAAYKEGLDLATRAIAADETNADAHFAAFANRGSIMALQGATANPFNILPMRRELDRTLELNPKHADALAAKGRMYRQLPRLLGGNLEKAAEYLSRAVELDPSDIGMRIDLAKTYRDLGHPERSVPLLESAAQMASAEGRTDKLNEARQLLDEVRPRPGK